MPAPVSRIQALQLLLEAAAPHDATGCPAADSIGLVAARDIAAGCDVPETACSVRDGYALRADDVKKAGSMRPVRLAVKQCIRAESMDPDPIGPGEAARVLTGGTVPPGADCVLAEEDVEAANGDILVTATVRPGWFVRPVGGEIADGTVITHGGREITPQAAAVMTRTRLAHVPVHPRPTARILALGSELAAPGEADFAHFPADNLVLTSGLFERAGATVTTTSVLPDEKARLVDTLSRTDLPDVVVTTGGTGNSERDFARSGALMSGFDILFDTVDMRPGRNVFAARRGRTLLFGLPGPPAAVFTCFHALILPVVRSLRGLPNPEEPVMARFTKGINVRPGSEWLVQCELVIDGSQLSASPLAGKEVPPMLGMGRATGLAVIQGGDTVRPGDEREILTTSYR
ncbi:molybdopterin molybdotransferase MoeA [Pseudodesulfovibrio portus]|uniref:Molybdopterin molybdenumtransferase n=1 Tax=Pseudodesulfovibrio portus TaxID=231439 RepID=A0ABM8ARN8_9BACT|nr:molybdopterin molybdotransferase MoeA [Pseudodesulfovibrio portus]BDQ34098.1 molybdopterin molybdenumtransferase MoeA [Pseudodesulfovibrio portus]